MPTIIDGGDELDEEGELEEEDELIRETRPPLWSALGSLP
jgi:hypothetical protein